MKKTNCEGCGRPIKINSLGIIGEIWMCPTCREKVYSEYKAAWESSHRRVVKACSRCDGTGKIKGYECILCGGTGKCKTIEGPSISVLPPNISEGQPI